MCSEASCKKPNPPLTKQQVLPICANLCQSARVDPGQCLVLSESLQCKEPFLQGPSFNLAGNCAALHTGLESAPHRWLQAPCNTCAPVLDQEEFVSTSPIAALLSCTSVPSFPSTLLTLCPCVSRPVLGEGGVCLQIIPIPKCETSGMFVLGVAFLTNPLSRVGWHPIHM